MSTNTPVVAREIPLHHDAAVMDALRDAPLRIAYEETQVMHKDVEVAEAKMRLEQEEARLVLTGAITGSNETTRKKQLAELTQDQREELRVLQNAAELARIELRYQTNVFNAARALARIIGGAA